MGQDRERILAAARAAADEAARQAWRRAWQAVLRAAGIDPLPKPGK